MRLLFIVATFHLLYKYRRHHLVEVTELAKCGLDHGKELLSVALQVTLCPVRVKRHEPGTHDVPTNLPDADALTCTIHAHKREQLNDAPQPARVFSTHEGARTLDWSEPSGVNIVSAGLTSRAGNDQELLAARQEDGKAHEALVDALLVDARLRNKQVHTPRKTQRHQSERTHGPEAACASDLVQPNAPWRSACTNAPLEQRLILSCTFIRLPQQSSSHGREVDAEW